MRDRFDQRTLAVLCSELGAIPLLVFGIASSTFVLAGTRGIAVAILAFTVISAALTAWQGKLDDRLFMVLCVGGMLGVAGSAAIITDPGSAHAVLVLLAAMPALAAMGSSERMTILFVLAATGLAIAVVAWRATSVTAFAIGCGAAVMAIVVPTLLVTMLRRTLLGVIAEQARLSLRDPLTLALNRRGLLDGARSVLDAAERSGRMLAVLVVDIDHFKRINDVHGHAVGDTVLVDITALLTDSVPDGTLVARTGGEEFTILAVADGVADLERISTRIRVAVSAGTPVTASVGGVCAPVHSPCDRSAIDVQRLLDALALPADQRLYAAKARGRNRSMLCQLAPITPEGAITPTPAPTSTPSADRPVHLRMLTEHAPHHLPRRKPPTTRGDDSVHEILHPVRDAARIAQISSSPSYELVDIWPQALEELRQLDALDHVDPDTDRNAEHDYGDIDVIDEHTRYIVFDWRRCMVRMPDSEIFYRLKTARNRFLVTDAEQRRWEQCMVAVAGLSVGSAAVTACALSGARHFRIADDDRLSPTNLNRMVGSVCDIGTTKLDLAVRRLLEADPYTAVEQFPNGYTPANAERFLAGDGATTVLIEEIDDVALKIDMRRRARMARIPVISATDMGDNVILDIERYDLDADYPIFHGRAEGFVGGDATDPAHRLRMAASIVGDALTPRMAYSASQIGRSVASWPQLGSTGTMAGAFAAAAARNIACGHPVDSGRHVLNIEDMLIHRDREYHWNEIDPEVVTSMFGAGPAPAPRAATQ